MKNRIIVIIGTALMWAAIIGAQTDKSTIPTLKPEVALKIRDVQLKQVQAENEFAQIQARIKTLQESYQQRQGQLASLLGTALKDSGLDAEKYELNPDTLEVKVKVSGAVPAPAASAPAEVKKP